MEVKRTIAYFGGIFSYIRIIWRLDGVFKLYRFC